jgi:hypothetical protein
MKEFITVITTNSQSITVFTKHIIYVTASQNRDRTFILLKGGIDKPLSIEIKTDVDTFLKQIQA